MNSNHFPSRRALIAGGLAAASAAYAAVRDTNAAPAAAAAARCVLAAQMTEGPFYLDKALIRRDVREDRQGLATTLRLKIVDAATCAPIPGAAADIWHCDARGDYSATFGGGRDTHFLRGRQIAANDGMVEFLTIYPGWYSGRTPHIHLKALVGERELATTQLFFTDDLSRAVYANAPYAGRGASRTTNSTDMLLRNSRGADASFPKITRQANAITASLTIGIKSVG